MNKVTTSAALTALMALAAVAPAQATQPATATWDPPPPGRTYWISKAPAPMGSAMAIKRAKKRVTIASVNGPAGLNCFDGKIRAHGIIRGWTLDEAPNPVKSTKKIIRKGDRLKEAWWAGPTIWKRVSRTKAATYRTDLTKDLKTCRSLLHN